MCHDGCDPDEASMSSIAAEGKEQYQQYLAERAREELGLSEDELCMLEAVRAERDAGGW
jgi:cell division protein FtsB